MSTEDYFTNIPYFTARLQRKILGIKKLETLSKNPCDITYFYKLLGQIHDYFEELNDISFPTQLDEKYDIMLQLFLDMHIIPCGIKIIVTRDNNTLYFTKTNIEN
jgi:hypothetical protein